MGLSLLYIPSFLEGGGLIEILSKEMGPGDLHEGAAYTSEYGRKNLMKALL